MGERVVVRINSESRSIPDSADHEPAGGHLSDHPRAVLPGAPGHAVLNGHPDTNLTEHHAAAFVNLRKVHPGDAAVVNGAGGSTLHFSVTALDHYPAEKAPLNQIFGASSDSMVELVTCAGTWREAKLGYSQRLVVTAILDRI